MSDKDKASDFKRLAVSRTNKALDSIRLVGNLSGGGYESTEEQRSRIFGALRASIDDAEARFAGKQDGEGFTL